MLYLSYTTLQLHWKQSIHIQEHSLVPIVNKLLRTGKSLALVPWF